MRPLLAAAIAVTTVGLTAPGAEAASITLRKVSCSNTVFDSFEEAGDWTRNLSGIGNGQCNSGSGVATGSVNGVESAAVAAAAGAEQSVSNQQTFGVTNTASYEFLVKGPLGSTDPVLVRISSIFTGNFSLAGISSTGSGATQAGAVVGASMFIDTVNSQVGTSASDAIGTSPSSPNDVATGSVTETLTVQRFVDVNTPFNVALTSNAFVSAGANLQFSGTLATSSGSADASLIFDTAQVLGVGSEYCITSSEASLDTCTTTPPVPPAAVPLPAAGMLLLGGLAGFGAFTRRRRG